MYFYSAKIAWCNKLFWANIYTADTLCVIDIVCSPLTSQSRVSVRK